MAKSYLGVVIAGLFMVACSSTRAQDGPQAGRQVPQRLELEGGIGVDYLIYLPADHKPAEPRPLLLFLHGRGESEGGIEAVAKWGPPRQIARGDQLPWIVVSPQCPANDRWDSDEQQRRVLALLEHLQATCTIDENRMVITGLSMGGAGVWFMTGAHPDVFAAAVPVCGWGAVESAGTLRKLPLWAWHGTDDRDVPFAGSKDMIDAIRAAGGEQARLTSLEGIGHNSWSAAYESPDLWAWMARQSLEK
jgi:predicted peptidase